MSVQSPWSIKYGDREVGGSSSTYQLHEPYLLEKDYARLRLTFNVAVIATDNSSDLQQLCDDLETDFRKRDLDLEINLSGSKWTYEFENTILNTQSEIGKAGDRESDGGAARVYTIVIQGDLPADDTERPGLRDLEVLVEREPSRQRIVTMRGVYTSVDGTLARAQYEAEFGNESGGEAQTILDGLNGDTEWELVEETGTSDRNDHIFTFFQQYVELIEEQSAGTLNDPAIRDHTIFFTELATHPGDSLENIHRLRRVVGSYDCAVDIDSSTDPRDVYSNKIESHIKELIRSQFQPKILAIEDLQIAVDETHNRISARIQFVYQPKEGGVVIEVTRSLTYREGRRPDRTPVHSAGELDAYIDVGFATVERVWTRVVRVVGDEFPKFRIAAKPGEGPAGAFSSAIVGAKDSLSVPDGVPDSGWVLMSNVSQVTDEYLGDPISGEQIKLSTLVETVTEEYVSKPEGATGGGAGAPGFFDIHNLRPRVRRGRGEVPDPTARLPGQTGPSNWGAPRERR